MLTKEAGIPKFTFGWELEATRRAARVLPGIEVGHDGSVGGESLEYRVRRELVFSPDKSLEALRNLATDTHLQVDQSCGFHVHVGIGQRTRKIHAWAAWFVTLARELEVEAFAAVPESRRTNSFCRTWRESQGSVMTQRYSASKGSNQDRYNWVNPVEIFRPGGIRTVEVRLMGNCKRYTYLLAWTAACRLMAMSSWALIFDPSRLEYEKSELRKVFALLKRDFLSPSVPGTKVAATALYLATKAKLTCPFGKSLEWIATREKEMKRLIELSASEKREYENTMRAMRQAIEEYRERARQAGVAPESILLPGDTVECIREPHDGNMTVGRLYRVIRQEGTHTTVYGDNGDTWQVENGRVKLRERMEVSTPCAV